MRRFLLLLLVLPLLAGACGDDATEDTPDPPATTLPAGTRDDPFGVGKSVTVSGLPDKLLIGLAACRGRRPDQPLENRPVRFYTVCVLAAVVTTAANTAVIWVDSILYGYYTFALVFGSALIRFVTGMITAVLVATVAMPLTTLLRRRALGWRT